MENLKHNTFIPILNLKKIINIKLKISKFQYKNQVPIY